MSDWEAEGEPLEVDETEDNGDPTEQEIADAQQNWDQMSPARKAYMAAVMRKVGLSAPGK